MSDSPKKPRRDKRAGGPGRPHVKPPLKSKGRPQSGRDRQGAPPQEAKGERIAKRLARAGVASRRDAEAMIADGRVSVNGKKLETPAFLVGDRDTILVDGAPIPERERTRLFLFHKPSGTMTTNRDPEGRRTIFDVLPKELPRLMTVGRLDFTTEGLLLLTNDGGLARVLELPSTGWLRRYRVRVHGTVDEAALDGLKEGIAVEGVLYGAIEAVIDRQQGSNAWLTVSLREGKNREIKKVFGALGLDVTRLIRVSYGPFQLGDLDPGAVTELKGRMLRDQLGPRLIEQAGADFTSDIKRPFSQKPPREPGGDKIRARDGESPPVRRQKRRDQEQHREEGLERLQTRRPVELSIGKGRFKKKEGPQDRGRAGKTGKPRAEAEEKRRSDPPRSRATNVWMAPGARPVGRKKPLEGKPVTVGADAARHGSGEKLKRQSGKNERRNRPSGSGKQPEKGDGTKRTDNRKPRPKLPAGPAMRIVGGEYRGRRLAAPAGHATRPTSDRARQSLFNVLEHRYAGSLEGARVLDLFAGTGALGLEAMSRGAADALFVEMAAPARAVIRANIEALGLQGRTKIFRRDATRLGDAGTIRPFDLLFADPTYGKSLGEPALASALAGGWLAENALCLIEERSDAPFVAPQTFRQIDQLHQGDTIIRFLRPV